MGGRVGAALFVTSVGKLKDTMGALAGAGLVLVTTGAVDGTVKDGAGSGPKGWTCTGGAGRVSVEGVDTVSVAVTAGGG